MIYHSQPAVVNLNELKRYINDILANKYFSENIYVKKFEEMLCNSFNSKYAISTSSGTSALYLSLLSLGIDGDSEVIIPSFSCSAVLNAVLYCNAKPVIVDVNLDDLNISYEEVKKHITKKTKAIIVPHMFGFPSKDIEKIVELGVTVIEDITQSLKAKVNRKNVGSFGKLNVVSFYATKLITTFGEGGAVLTNDYKLYKIIKDLKEYDKKDKFILRYNYKITEVQAAMGIVQLESLDEFIKKRREIFRFYQTELCDIKDIEILTPLPKIDAVFYRCIIKFLKKQNLKHIISEFKKCGVEVNRPVYLPLDKYYFGEFVCKNSKLLYDTTLSLPIYPSLKKQELRKIVSVLKNILKKLNL